MIDKWKLPNENKAWISHELIADCLSGRSLSRLLLITGTWSSHFQSSPAALFLWPREGPRAACLLAKYQRPALLSSRLSTSRLMWLQSGQPSAAWHWATGLGLSINLWDSAALFHQPFAPLMALACCSVSSQAKDAQRMHYMETTLRNRSDIYSHVCSRSFLPVFLGERGTNGGSGCYISSEIFAFSSLTPLLQSQTGSSPHSSPSHSASCTMPMPIRSTSAGSTPTHTPQDCLAGVGDDVLDAFSQGEKSDAFHWHTWSSTQKEMFRRCI